MRLDHLLSMENVLLAGRREGVIDRNKLTDGILIEKYLLFDFQGPIPEVGVINAQGPPVPIPNTEVKLCSAEDTLPATARENRSTPTPRRQRCLRGTI